MKKKFFATALVAICLSISIVASGTLAYFTSQETSHNVITSDAVNIALEEWQDTEDGRIPYPKDEPIEIMPGIEISKIPTVKNIDASAYIRARVEITVYDADGNVMDISEDTLNSLISLDFDTENWLTKSDEQWFYYSKALGTGNSTEPLFTEVSFDGPNMTNEYQNCTVDIAITAQAVQSANNGSSALKAAGWPVDVTETENNNIKEE